MTPLIDLKYRTQQLIRSFAQLDETFDRDYPPDREHFVMDELHCLNQRLSYLFCLDQVHDQTGEDTPTVILSDEQLQKISKMLPESANNRESKSVLRDSLREKLLSVLIQLEDLGQKEGESPSVQLPPVTALSTDQLHQVVMFEIRSTLDTVNRWGISIKDTKDGVVNP